MTSSGALRVCVCVRASYLAQKLTMKDGVDHAEHLLDETFPRLGDPGGGRVLASALQFVLHLIQQLAQELLRVLLCIAPKRWNQLPHRVQHGKRRDQRPLAGPHDLEQGVQLVAEGDVLGAGLFGLDQLHAPTS